MPLTLPKQVAELKVLTAERGISMIEVKEGMLMFTRNNDFIHGGQQVPDLTKSETMGRLKEIKRVLLAL
jgi:hypothetical protein